MHFEPVKALLARSARANDSPDHAKPLAFAEPRIGEIIQRPGRDISLTRAADGPQCSRTEQRIRRSQCLVSEGFGGHQPAFIKHDLKRVVEPGRIERCLVAAKIGLGRAAQLGPQPRIARGPGEPRDDLLALLRLLRSLGRIGSGARIEPQRGEPRAIELFQKPAITRFAVSAEQP